MLNNKQILAVVATLFAQQALALNAHRHGHRGFHNKKDVVVVQETDLVTVTNVHVVTVNADGSPVVAETPASAAVVTEQQAPAAAATTTETTPTPSPTTLVPSTTSSPKPAATTSTTPAVKAAQAKEDTTSAAPSPSTTSTTPAAPSTTSSAAATSSSAASSGSTGGNKRGLAYNAGNLLSPFLNSGSKVSWSYNWGQTADSSAPTDIEYVPMMWGPTFADTWSDNAEKAIANGAKNFLSFNEPDNAGQANLDAATAASLHQQYLNPYSDKVRISTPAITNSHNNNEGVQWLTNFLSACGGKCAFDFCAAHWYNGPDTSDFLNHLLDVHNACGKSVWITEFAPTGSDEEINSFLLEVMDHMDNNSTFSFVERYSYFMAATGSLLTSETSLSTFGQSYAYN